MMCWFRHCKTTQEPNSTAHSRLATYNPLISGSSQVVCSQFALPMQREGERRLVRHAPELKSLQACQSSAGRAGNFHRKTCINAPVSTSLAF